MADTHVIGSGMFCRRIPEGIEGRYPANYKSRPLLLVEDYEEEDADQEEVSSPLSSTHSTGQVHSWQDTHLLKNLTDY